MGQCFPDREESYLEVKQVNYLENDNCCGWPVWNGTANVKIMIYQTNENSLFQIVLAKAASSHEVCSLSSKVIL